MGLRRISGSFSAFVLLGITVVSGLVTMKDQYSSFAGFPLAGATLPVIAVLLLGIYSGNLVVICSAVILGIGHIGIHYMHGRE